MIEKNITGDKKNANQKIISIKCSKNFIALFLSFLKFLHLFPLAQVRWFFLRA